MALQDKYAALLQEARNMGITDLAMAEKDGVLHVSGTAGTSADYDRLWSMYEQIDPKMASGDLLMNIDVKAEAGSRIRVTTDSSNLNIRSGPSTESEIVGKAGHDEIVTLVEKTNDSWWKIRTKDGEEGYAYTQYLSPE
jgi:uncharacterized protein YgiM (DUF1202 family)